MHKLINSNEKDMNYNNNIYCDNFPIRKRIFKFRKSLRKPSTLRYIQINYVYLLG